MALLESIIIVGIVFSLPITAIVTTHLRKSARIKYEVLQQEIELEKIKQQNYLLETEKMKVELAQMKLETSSNLDNLLQMEKNDKRIE